MVDAAELEGLAAWVLEDAGFELDEPVNIRKLIRARLGPDGYQQLPRMPFTRAALITINGRQRICSTPRATAFDESHELGHRERNLAGIVSDDEEADANFLGGAILMPARAVLRAVRSGLSLSEMAELFGTSETAMALRVAELLRMPRAIIAPKHIHLRGPDGYVMPAEPVLRSLAKRTRPGVLKVRMRDDPSRVVLDFDDALSA